MRRNFFKPIRQFRSKNLQQPPGTLQTLTDATPTQIDLMVYSADTVQEHKDVQVSELDDLLDTNATCWLQVNGLASTASIDAIGKMFGLHPLAIEDVLSIPQRSKQEDYGDYLFTVCQMFHDRDTFIQVEQISMFITPRAVIVFQEFPGDCFNPLRTRIREKRGRIRQQGHDYLFYALLDSITDHYFPLLEKQGTLLDEMEHQLFEDISKDQGELQELMNMRRTLMAIRKVLWPFRDTIQHLSREPHKMLSEEVRVYFRDCHDHTLRLIDLLEGYREMNAHLKDVSLNLASQRLNEVMKVLTIISTIFIPLSFLAGLYGMNFDQGSPYNMPELKWAYGYPTLLLVMLITALVLVGYFVKKGWLFQRNTPS